MRRLLALCIGLCICFSAITCIPAFAADTSGSCGSGVTWSFDPATGALSFTGKGAIEDYSDLSKIPWKVYCPDVKTISVGDGITRIGNHALTWCEQVTSVTLPASVTELGTKAFGWCTGLTQIALPSGLKKIGDSAFTGDIALESITIPASVESIASTAFYQCSALKEIVAQEGNPVYSTANGVLYSGTNSSLVSYPIGKTDSSFTVPDGIRTVEEAAFYQANNLTEVNLGSVDKIGRRAFAGCEKLYTVTAGSVSVIEELAFYGCRAMVKFVFPQSVVSVGDRAFRACENLQLAIFLGAPEVGNEVFRGADYIAVVAGIGTAMQNYAWTNNIPFYSMASVVYNGSAVYFDPSAFVVNDATTMVPMRTVFEMLGAQVTWEETTNTAIAAKDGVTVSIQIGSSNLYRNGESIALPETGKLIADKTYVPLRAVSEAFGNTVEWIDAQNTVNIY